MNNLDSQYQRLLQDIIEFGVDKKDRTGTGTKSIFGYTIHHNMRNGFPLLTTKKVAFKTMATELMWFLMGDTNIKYLIENGCHIWDGDAYKNYMKNVDLQDIESRKYEDGELTTYNQEEFINKIKTDDEFAKKWGELGPVYGRMWRAFDEDVSGGIDQIANLINDLKTNPDSRRLLVTAWNPTYLPHQVLPPCHYGFQVYTRELSIYERAEIYVKKNNTNINIDTNNDPTSLHLYFTTNNIPTRAISLMWNQRSVDVPLGLPFNIASYGLLLEIIAKSVNMVPDELIGNLGDCHIYSNQIDGVKEQLTREPYPLPKLNIIGYPQEYLNPYDGRLFDEFEVGDFVIENYQSHPSIKMPLSN